MTLTLGDLAQLRYKLDRFRVAHPDYGPSREPTICVHCEEIGVGKWTCYCRRDD